MKPDEVATIMLSVSPFKAALSSENATNETHPQHNHALDIQPYVTVSRHTAPTSQLLVIRASCQWANSFGASRRVFASQSQARQG